MGQSKNKRDLNVSFLSSIMKHYNTAMLTTYQLLLIFISVVVTLSIINFPIDNTVFYIFRAVFSLLFILFLPGYLLILTLLRKFRKETEGVEKFVFGVIVSICITIFSALFFHFIGVNITFSNILNLLVSITEGLLILIVLTKNVRPSHWNLKLNRFSIYLSLFLLFVGFVILVSAISPSKEEFIEIYWEVFRSNNFFDRTDIVCELDNCSLSGIYMQGKLNLGNDDLDIIATDSENFGVYDSFCIDVNNNSIYCENDEGPFEVNDSFFIDSNGYYIQDFRDKELVILHYPKETNISDFRVGFTIESFYSKPMTLEIDLFINENFERGEIVSLNPREKIRKNIDISLFDEGLSEVEIFISSTEIDTNAFISFWAEKIITNSTVQVVNTSTINPSNVV